MHLRLHDRTNGPARRKEKIGDINFVLKCVVRNDVAILIDEAEVLDRMFNCIATVNIPAKYR
jgi:hypothetical protein